MQQWFDNYSISHQNKTNQKIHLFCVPIIYFSIVGLLMCIPPSFLKDILNEDVPLLENWAVLISVLVLLFYLRLDLLVFVQMLLFSLFCLLTNFALQKAFNLRNFSLVLFSLGWIGQFYGHKIEGKKPSFVEDVQFLLIGPAWVFKKLFGHRYKN